MPGSASDANWDRLHDLFSRALELPPEQRNDFIAGECRYQPELAQEVLSLLACDVGTGASPLTNAMNRILSDASHERRLARIGRTIGAYRISALIGHGGVGTVYLGERADDRYSAKVAIKVVDSAALHPDLGLRFRAERQILASLDHGNIARLIDAGETENARPYLVMEYVEGKAFDVYCDEQQLSLDERLELFLQLCAAVQYAHQHLIIHRDLKPANVLVTSDGVPKLLDFGIAKLLAPSDALPVIALTRVNDRLLTPKYASPEQILGQPVTTATDVYSLGTLLYELLTGLHPFGLAPAPSQFDLERLIASSDALTPSAGLQLLIDGAAGERHENLTRIAAARQLNPQRLAQRLAGDLDAICLRALNKEPQHRYRSVEQLAADVRRHLSNRPVTARQRTWLYCAERFLRRHTLGVAAVAACIGIVIAFAIATSVQAHRIAIERDRAALEGNRAEAVSAFMLDVFETTHLSASKDHEVTARELLDHAAQRIDNELEEQPEVQARLTEAIGQSYNRLGYYARAVTYLNRALQFRQRHSQPDNAALVTLLLKLATAQRENGQLGDAGNTLRTASELMERHEQRNGPERARLTAATGRLYLDQGDWRGAEKALTDGVMLMREAQEIEPFELVVALSELAAVEMWKGDFLAAERMAREAVRISSERLSELHPERVSTEFQLAELLAVRGTADEEAASLLERVLKARRALYGENSRVADALDILARIRERHGKAEEAEQLLRQALEIQKRSLGPDHFLVGYQHTSLGVLLLRRGRPRAAEQEIRAALEIYRKSLSADHQFIASAEHVLGEALIAQSRCAQAEQILLTARARWQRSAAPPWRVARTTSALGEAVYRQNRAGEGERLLIDGYNGVTSDPAATPEARAVARNRLIRFYTDMGHPEKIPRGHT